jgi:hypothetical protein
LLNETVKEDWTVRPNPHCWRQRTRSRRTSKNHATLRRNHP